MNVSEGKTSWPFCFFFCFFFERLKFFFGVYEKKKKTREKKVVLSEWRFIYLHLRAMADEERQNEKL